MRRTLDTFAEILWDGGWRIALLSAALGLLLWGWFALKLSPVERYYFPAYVGSSLHLVNGSEPDSVAWLVKTRTKKEFDIAATADVVPADHGAMPFALSPLALQQGWTGTKFLKALDYQAGSQRVVLQENFFSGASLGWLLFQPMELLAVPLFLWASFVRWRYKREQERPPAWSWNYSEPSWAEDAAEFTSELYGAVKFCAVSGWRGVQAGRTAVKRWQESGSVSPSVAAVPEKKVALAAESKVVAVVAAPFLKPEPAKAEQKGSTAEPSRAQTLPFRKRPTAQSGEKWDESKWID